MERTSHPAQKRIELCSTLLGLTKQASHRRTWPKWARWKEKDRARSPCLRVRSCTYAGAIAMMANSEGFPTRAFTSRTLPKPWMVSRFCNLSTLATIKSLMVDHVRTPLLVFSAVQCLKRYLRQHGTYVRCVHSHGNVQ